MAVKRSQNWINQQRVDVPHLRSIESAIRNDFDELFTALITGEDESYVIRGMKIEMAGSIGASANGLQLIVEDSSILHGKSNESGTFFNIPTGTSNQVLSATTNTRVDGAFTPAALNYVSIEFTRQVDDSTTSQLYLWNPTTKNEITKTLPLAEVFDYKIVISSSIFGSNVLPLAIVETDSSNNVLSVQDRREMLFSTATAGSTTPDPFNEFVWTDGRTPNFWESASSSISPFEGGDKQIKTFKDNDLALKTEIKLMKGTQYWSSPNIGGSIAGLRYDLGNTIMTGRGSISHDAGNAGLINWTDDIFLTVLSTRLKYKLEANVATTDVDLNDKQVAYIKIVRNVDIIPQLIFTNGSAVINSVGAISWTADLEAGDFVKVAAEEDFAYYQIQSINSTSKVTLTEVFGGVSTGINGADAKYAWGNYRTDAAPSTDRHIKVANLEDMPFDADTFWLFFRDDNAGISRIYVRFLNAELKQGEVITIADQVPAAVLAYMGSASDVDADPNYATIATGGKTGGENYNSVQGENLTIRNSKLTSMMADKAQDKTIQLVSDHTSVANTTNAAAQEITMAGGSGTATVIMPSSANNGTIGTGGTLSLNVNQCAYYQVDRNAVFNLANLAALTVVDITAVPHDENTFIFAYRLADTTVHLWNGEVLLTGSSIALSVLRGYVQQNKTVKLVKGGTWSWDLGTNTLQNSASSYIQVGGLAENVNELAAQSIVLDADGKCAYVTLKRNAGASVLTVNVADIAAVPQDDHTFIVARRTNNDVIVGTSSFALKDREFLELDGALAEINRYHGQLALSPEAVISTRVAISGSDIAKLSGSQLSLEQKNLLLAFDGAVIDFETGEVFESDGVTPFLGGANDFTPFVIGANEYFYYSVSVLPNTANADNTISGQILVIPAISSNAVLASAPKAPFPGSGLKLANIYVQEDGAAGILDIDFANIIQLGVGGGSGGSGNANAALTRYQDRLNLAPFDWANTNIAEIDESDQLDGASTATFDIPTGSFKFADSTAQVLQSIQQLDSGFLLPVDENDAPLDPIDITTAELYAIWVLESIDSAATYEVTRDGVNWQALAVGRIGKSDAYRALHNFTDEPSNAFNQEYAVTEATALKDFDDASVKELSQKFTVIDTTVYKNVILYINKATASATGRFCVEIVKDDAGAPSSDPNDVVWTSAGQNIDDLAVGNNVVNISGQFVVRGDTADYHINVTPDDAYRVGYTANNADKISWRIDNTAGPVPNIRTSDGITWSAEVANETATYRLEGRVLDVRVRITSAASAGDKFLSSYGLFYQYENGIQYSNPVFQERFKFDGTVDNDNEFVLTNFLPDSRLLFCFAKGTGQTFRYGDFVLDGHKVVFPPNTFQVVGDVELEFFQIQSVSGPASTVADALLTANALGSTDASIDKSIAGRGIILRNSNGDLVEISVNALNQIVITP